MDPVTLASISPLAEQPASNINNRAVSAPATEASNGMSFSDLLSQTATNFKDKIESAEATSIQGLKGEVDCSNCRNTQGGCHCEPR